MFPGHLFAIFLFGGALWIAAHGVAGAYLARMKNREAWFGAVLGIFLGVIGLVILVLLPEGPAAGPVWSSGPPPAAPARSALDIATERYARGEITREEFQQLRADLAAG